MSDKIRSVIQIGGEKLLLPDGVTEGEMLTFSRISDAPGV